MNARNSNQQKYSNVGEQAGRVISEFISIADDVSKRFEKEFSAKDRSRGSTGYDSSKSPNDEPVHSPNDSPIHNKNNPDSAAYTRVGKDYSNKGFRGDRESPVVEKSDLENEWRNAGEYLRELREAAGYTVDGFAKAMNRHDAANKIKSVEEGREIFPNDWLDQLSALLKQNDPMEFFERLRGLYDAETQDDAQDDDYAAEDAAGESSAVAGSGVINQRRQKLQSIFSDDQLQGLSDSQFQELLSFVEINFQSALQLVRNK